MFGSAGVVVPKWGISRHRKRGPAMRAGKRALRVIAVASGLLIFIAAISSPSRGQDSLDRNRIKELYDKSKRGDKLTPAEQQYLDRALQELKAKGKPPPASPSAAAGKWQKTIYVGPVKQLL